MYQPVGATKMPLLKRLSDTILGLSFSFRYQNPPTQEKEHGRREYEFANRVG